MFDEDSPVRTIDNPSRRLKGSAGRIAPLAPSLAAGAASVASWVDCWEKNSDQNRENEADEKSCLRVS